MKVTKSLVVMLVAASTAFAFSLSSVGPHDQKSQEGETRLPQERVFWREPVDIETRNLFWGPGGEANQPDLTNVRFIRKETGGYSTKFRVQDGSGRVWVAKLGKEAQTETVAVRLVWAVGYPTEINYLVPCVIIQGAPSVSRNFPRCEGGGFANVRFEARPENVDRKEHWNWQNNPFKNSKEFQGLVILMALINNWDLKDSNNRILLVRSNGTGLDELHYIVSDLGATFGKRTHALKHVRNEPEIYVKTEFVEKVEGSRVRFDYSGKNSSLLDNITVEQAKWIGNLLSRLSDEQIKDAFRAANYGPQEIDMLSRTIRTRINQLVNL